MGSVKRKKDFLIIKEIFYSLQGEGYWYGEPMIFIRLAGCNLDCAFCDTDWKKGTKWLIEEIREYIKRFDCKKILWTGGEPSLQLTNDIVDFFHQYGYWQAIETNGTKKPPSNLDWITLSPKVPLSRIKEVWRNVSPNEIKFLVDIDTKKLPSKDYFPEAIYWVSPIFFENQPNFETLKRAIEIVKKNKGWRLTTQMHKFWGIK